MSRHLLTPAIMFGLLLFPYTVHGGVLLGFDRVEPSNAAENIASQLQVELLNETDAESMFGGIDVPSGNVLFVITNAVGINSSISEVYFDDGTLMGTPTIFNSLGGSTSFANGANPGNLPGGNNVIPPFVATAAFSVDAQGNPSNGVSTSSDILGLAFELIAGNVFDDVVDALVSGDLRVGMHVRAIGTGSQSDAFVNKPIPEPTALALAALASALVLIRRGR